MAQRQASFPLSQSQFSRRQRQPRRRKTKTKKPASIHPLVAAAFAITIIFYAINYLYYSHTTHVAYLDDDAVDSQQPSPVENDQNRNKEEQRTEDDRDDPETGK